MEQKKKIPKWPFIVGGVCVLALLGLLFKQFDIGNNTEQETTEATTTEATTTEAITTEAATEKQTQAPTTEAPTTEAPTTQAPTQAPTTEAPTQAPTTEAPTQAPTTQAKKIIGNIKSSKYHTRNCGYLPDEENRIYFNSIEEAQAAGYEHCKKC